MLGVPFWFVMSLRVVLWSDIVGIDVLILVMVVVSVIDIGCDGIFEWEKDDNDEGGGGGPVVVTVSEGLAAELLSLRLFVPGSVGMGDGSDEDTEGCLV